METDQEQDIWQRCPDEGMALLAAYAEASRAQAAALNAIVNGDYEDRREGQGIHGRAHQSPCEVHGGVCDHTFEWDFVYQKARDLFALHQLRSRDAQYTYLMVMNQTLLARPWGFWCPFDEDAWDQHFSQLTDEHLRHRPWFRWVAYYGAELKAVLNGGRVSATVGRDDLVRSGILRYEPGPVDGQRLGAIGWNVRFDEWRPDETAHESHRRQEMVTRMVANGDLPAEWITRLTLTEWRKIRELVFERDDYTCQYCGVTCGPWHCDHIIPRHQGGSDDADNLVTACAACNISKRDKTPEEWMTWLTQRKAAQ